MPHITTISVLTDVPNTKMYLFPVHLSLIPRTLPVVEYHLARVLLAREQAAREFPRDSLAHSLDTVDHQTLIQPPLHKLDTEVPAYTKVKSINKVRPGKTAATMSVNVLTPARANTNALRGVRELLQCQLVVILRLILMTSAVRRWSVTQQLL